MWHFPPGFRAAGGSRIRSGPGVGPSAPWPGTRRAPPHGARGGTAEGRAGARPCSSPARPVGGRGGFTTVIRRSWDGSCGALHRDLMSRTEISLVFAHACRAGPPTSGRFGRVGTTRSAARPTDWYGKPVLFPGPIRRTGSGTLHRRRQFTCVEGVLP